MPYEYLLDDCMFVIDLNIAKDIPVLIDLTRSNITLLGIYGMRFK